LNREGFWSVSDVLNHMYCPWITYNWYVLKIPQSKTTKTEEGARKQEEYLKKVKKHPERGVGGIKGARFIPDRPMRSHRLMLAGKCDFVVYPDYVPIPLEIKNEKAPRGKPFKNVVYQLACYAVMMEEEMGVCIDQGFVHYLKGGLTQKIEIGIGYKKEIERILEEMNLILEKEIVHGKPLSWKCCWDCCYRKICANSGGS